MSTVTKCDGCTTIRRQSERPENWLKVDIRNGYATQIAVGDFCTADCLAKFLASDKLDKKWKRGTA